MSNKVRISFVVDKDRADTIVGLMIQEVSNFHVEEIANGHQVKSIDWTRPHVLAVLQHMKSKPSDAEHFYKDIGAAVNKVTGLHASSISGVLSAMTAAKKIRKTRRGHYALA